MSKRIKDDELKELACYYNEEGKGSLYELLRDQYEIKNRKCFKRRRSAISSTN